MSSDFHPIEAGGGFITIPGVAFGEGAFNEGPFGGEYILTISPTVTPWTDLETEEDSDFSETGDKGQLIVEGSVYGMGGYGEGAYGGGTITPISGLATIWTNVGTP